MYNEAAKQAEKFLREETEFHLGAMPTEQSHPVTKNFSQVISQNIESGISLLQQVDNDIKKVLPGVLGSKEWTSLRDALLRALREKRRICFSGCGATGRVSILIEAAYRRFRRERPDWNLPDVVFSLMTGGDYALVRSVESFEDYVSFGRQQVKELELSPGDVLVAITEGGETSSVIGTAWQALEDGASVFFACNNPLDVLSAHVKRSREIIAAPCIIKLDLSTGPMAIAGSTRMQATTSEILVVGAALEEAMLEFAGMDTGELAPKYVARFAKLLDDLSSPAAIKAISKMTLLEEEVYRENGAVTYFADRALLDIFTDTTERAPTFMLPPFRKCDDTNSPRSWVFVKNPLCDTAQAWEDVYQRCPRCLDWTTDTYSAMNASEQIVANPPCLNAEELCKFNIGNEDDSSRYLNSNDLAMLVFSGDEAKSLTQEDGEFMRALEGCMVNFHCHAALSVGPNPLPESISQTVIHIPCSLPDSPLRLWEHLALKLVLNTVSTATMARLGRVTGNWMSNVETTNKKLIDRGTRLISEITGISYEDACKELYRTNAELRDWKPQQGERPSPVAYSIKRVTEKSKF